MENATKALLIAGGIFITIVILTVGVFTYSSLHKIAKSQDELTEQEQIVAFNKRYEAFHRELIHGTDVITLMNMAYEDNKKSEDVINVEIIASGFVNTNAYLYNEDTSLRDKKENGMFKFNQDTIREYSKSKDETKKAIFNDFKRRVFRCTEVGYDNQYGTGRIVKMIFEEVKLNDYTHI